MKIAILIFWLLVISWNASSQQSAPTLPNAPAAVTPPIAATPPNPPVAPAQPTVPSAPEAAGQTVPAGVTRLDQLSPELRNRLFGSNGVPFGTNVLRTAGTNQGQFIGTNQFGTNGISLTNQAGAMMQDRAVSIADQRLLLQVRARVQSLLPPAAPFTPVPPIHFVVQDNVVTLLGAVPNEAEKQQLRTAVERTPGVVRVIDQLNVNAQAHTGAALASGNRPGMVATNGFNAGLINQVPMNSNLVTAPLQRNNFIGSMTNLTPTGRTNAGNMIFGTNASLPPRLQNRQELAPGLERRDELPPGLQRTNPPSP